MESPIAMDVDKLSYEIFSLLESKFLFGGAVCLSGAETPVKQFLGANDGRVRVLSIDGCGAGAGDALLAAATLARLEARLQHCADDPDARVADFFDVAAGSGAGGVLAAMLFLRGPDGRPRYTAEEALAFVAGSVGKDCRGLAKLFRGGSPRKTAERSFRRVFGDATLRDTVAPVLVACYDLATAAPFVFSRADAVESDGFDFRLRDVCAATCASGGGATSIRSVDGRTAIVAASGGVAGMSNPASAAITHVLHNKQEFPLVAGMDDILLLSIGTGASSCGAAGCNTPMPTRSPSPDELARVTAQGVADMVDEAVAMAFGHASGGNYVRIQARKVHAETAASATGAMLSQRNVESVLFRGRRVSERTNGDKVDALAAELVKEQERRMLSPLPNVVIKQVASPRLSSATTASSFTATVRTASTMPSPVSYDSRR